MSELKEIKNPTERCCVSVNVRDSWGSSQCARKGRYEHDGKKIVKLVRSTYYKHSNGRSFDTLGELRSYQLGLQDMKIALIDSADTKIKGTGFFEKIEEELE